MRKCSVEETRKRFDFLKGRACQVCWGWSSKVPGVSLSVWSVSMPWRYWQVMNYVGNNAPECCCRRRTSRYLRKRCSFARNSPSCWILRHLRIMRWKSGWPKKSRELSSTWPRGIVSVLLRHEWPLIRVVWLTSDCRFLTELRNKLEPYARKELDVLLAIKVRRRRL